MSRVLSALALLLAIAGCSADVVSGSGAALTGAVDAPVPDGVTSPAVATDAFESGLLTEPSTAAPEEIAIAYASSRSDAELRVVRVQRAGGGALVRLRQVAGGLDVIGADAAVRLDAEGRVRWASLRTADVDGLDGATPSLHPLDALRAARGDDGARALDLDPAEHAELVVYAGPGPAAARLAYHVRFEDELSHETYRAYVDATSGAVLSREGLTAHFHRARVWDVSPVDSELEEVVFDALDPNAETLADDDVTVLGCVDERMCHEYRTTMGMRAVHHCEMRPTALPDPEESFLVHAPPRSHRAPEDPFAEVQAYHHVRSGLAAFRRWAGDQRFALDDRLTTIVNMRVPDLESDAALCQSAGDPAPRGSELQIEENAYFWPAGKIGPTELGDRIVMHQTERTDWAYDGEIIWHELTHAVMHSLTPLAFRYVDERGLNPEPGGLHEGFSDYFAAAITNRSTLAWYGGTDEAGTPTPLNDLEKEASCAEVLDGEEHDESEPWAGALWAIRRSLRSGAKREMFDRVSFVALSSLGQFDGFARASEIVLAELDVAAEELAESEAMDRDARAFFQSQVDGAEGILARHGFPECGGRIADVALGEGREYVQLLGPREVAEYLSIDAVPAPLDLRVTLDREVDVLEVRIGEMELYDRTFPSADAPTRPAITALLRAGDAPIRWQWALPRGHHDAERQAPMALAADGASGAAVFEGPFAPGVYHLTLVNAGASVSAYDLWVSSGDDTPADGFEPSSGRTSSSGCATAPGAPPGGAALFLFFLVALFRGRSSRRGHDVRGPRGRRASTETSCRRR